MDRVTSEGDVNQPIIILGLNPCYRDLGTYQLRCRDAGVNGLISVFIFARPVVNPGRLIQGNALISLGTSLSMDRVSRAA